MASVRRRSPAPFAILAVALAGCGTTYISTVAVPGEAGYSGSLTLTAAAGEYADRHYPEAWRQAVLLLQQDPKDWRSWQLLGNCQSAMGDTPAALRSWRTSLRLHPDNPGLAEWVSGWEEPR